MTPPNALVPAPKGSAQAVISRCALTIAVILLYGWINTLLYPIATITTADQAAKQFDNNDVSAVTAVYGMNFLGHLGIPFVVLLLLLGAIWWHPVRRRLKPLMALGILLPVLQPHPAAAYYDKSDYTKAHTILPNESGFWIPDIGGNKDSQAKFESEAYLNANRVALKRFIVPHAKLQGSGAFFDFYVPAGRLIIVGRTPFSREWVDAADRGTSRQKEGFSCQSREGINIAVGTSVGALVTEANATKYLYRFGVLPPAGERSDPRAIFNSVYYSRMLADAMDDVGRKKIQTLVCDEITAGPSMPPIRKPSRS